ncbi:hypothetical protein DVH05_001469 [Phytophthora capsici]|nr:hypothetical protein DVH05_001469 [Phytophthora capsici]
MNMLQLNPGEYITSMETHRNKNRQTKEHARVFYLVRHERISGGSQTDSMGSTTAPASYQLAEFYGLDGGQVDVVASANIPEPGTSASSVVAIFDPSASMGSSFAAADGTVVFPVATSIKN